MSLLPVLALFLDVAASSPRFLDGPFSKQELDRHLEICPDGGHSLGNRQRRATINGLVKPWRAAYLTTLFCAGQSHLVVVVVVSGQAYSATVASYDPTGRRDPFRSLLLRDDLPGAPPEIRLGLADRTVWLGVGASGRPSLADGALPAAFP